MKRISQIFLFFLIGLSSVHAKKAKPVQPFEADCTTTPKIQFSSDTRIPDLVGTEEARDAILEALGASSTAASWGNENFKGQWYFEYSEGDVIYAGLSIRTHYLQMAIKYDDKNVTTIVCDSRNLDQGKRSIHRKVPIWKQKLDTRIRIALGQASEFARMSDRAVAEGEKELQYLYELGVLSNEEFQTIRSRLNKTAIARGPGD